MYRYEVGDYVTVDFRTDKMSGLIIDRKITDDSVNMYLVENAGLWVLEHMLTKQKESVV